MSDSLSIICIQDKQPLMCTIFTLCSIKYDKKQKQKNPVFVILFNFS